MSLKKFPFVLAALTLITGTAAFADHIQTINPYGAIDDSRYTTINTANLNAIDAGRFDNRFDNRWNSGYNGGFLSGLGSRLGFGSRSEIISQSAVMAQPGLINAGPGAALETKPGRLFFDAQLFQFSFLHFRSHAKTALVPGINTYAEVVPRTVGYTPEVITKSCSQPAVIQPQTEILRDKTVTKTTTKIYRRMQQYMAPRIIRRSAKPMCDYGS